MLRADCPQAENSRGAERAATQRSSGQRCPRAAQPHIATGNCWTRNRRVGQHADGQTAPRQKIAAGLSGQRLREAPGDAAREQLNRISRKIIAGRGTDRTDSMRMGGKAAEERGAQAEHISKLTTQRSTASAATPTQPPLHCCSLHLRGC
ncbi:hypothetical protein CBR_g22070 [Chara braunii]|uniref:Uncharacterized protein n=1 Tax=Chara braunii TaxID=69332 RepID=A0A388L298_CHABU|nr:hypothetical protein CBR_g22070 [Chara braunii]|eukprot:GBG76323.1 hypothetical protein CBR_g22070 [Chara braunii]